MSPLERIVAACGGVILDGGRRALIPGPDHSPKDRSVSLVLGDDGRIVIHCFSPKDDWRSVRDALARKGLLNADGDDGAPWTTLNDTVVDKAVSERRIERARRLWAESRPIASTIAETYLRKRAIAPQHWNDLALRFHPRMTGFDDRPRRPALMNAITNASGALQGVQVTLLSAHGVGKAAVATPRRVIGRLRGGVVALSPAQDALIVAEGVESALSVAEALGDPAWAALSADNLSRFDPPAQVRRLIIAPDNDAPGLAAAQTLARRCAGKCSVEISPPPHDVGDWNDWLSASKRGRH